MAGCSVTLLKLDDELLGCGTRRCTRRPAVGRLTDERQSVTHGGPRARGCGSSPQLVAENRDRSPSWTRRSATPTTAPTWTAGMTAVVAALDETPPPTPAALLKKVGMTLVSTVGGASGPLYGTLFLRMGGAPATPTRRSAGRFATALRAGLDGVVARGKAEAGRQDDVRRAGSRPSTPWTRRSADGEPLAAALDAAPRTPPRPAGTRRRRCSPARAGPATSASAASGTRTRARRRSRCCSRRDGAASADPADGRAASDGDDAMRTGRQRIARRRDRRRLAQPGAGPRPRWRWPPRCCTAATLRIEVAAGLDETTFGTDAVQHHRGDRAGRQRRTASSC